MGISSLSKYLDKIHAILSSLLPDKGDVAMMDYPNYANVGDSAIWLGEKVYLDTRTTCNIIAVASREFPSLSKNTVILINGGGNFGDLWPQHQDYRELLIQHYPDNRIIQLPQSIHFQDESNAERCRDVLKSHSDFHLLVRDHASLKLAGRIYDGPTYLCPDMALCLGCQPHTAAPKCAIVGLLRTDKEKMTVDGKSALKQAPYYYADWLDEDVTTAQWFLGRVLQIQNNFPRWTKWLNTSKPYLFHTVASERFKRGCDILCSGEVVITDRLHGHIMCCLLAIPHVVLDNSYRKIGNFRDAWGTGKDFCLSANSLPEAHEKATELLANIRRDL